MTFWELYSQCWKKGFDFKSRARREEVWAWWGVKICLMAVLLLPNLMAVRSFPEIFAAGIPAFFGITAICFWVLMAVMFVPEFALGVRRCHDIGWNGGICAIACLFWIPVAGPFFAIATLALWVVLGVMEGKTGPNPYGALSMPDKGIRCERCHAAMPASAKFCAECGAENPLICEKCKNYLPSVDAKFCPSCGAQNMRLLEREAAEAKAKAEREEAEARARAEREAAAAALVPHLTSQMLDIPGRNFKLCKYEVTQALWEAVMGENPSRFKGADRPVERVSWNDCQEFIEKLNAMPAVEASGLVYRLPTEDEWKYACRAGSMGKYCKLADGTEITERTLARVAWYDDNSEGETHPVGQKEPNAFGLYDMHGNVWEWTATADGGNRVSCGGSWDDYADDCTADRRGGSYPGDRSTNLGFRLAAKD